MPDVTNPHEQWRRDFLMAIREIQKLSAAINALASYKNENIVLLRGSLQSMLKEWQKERDALINELGAGLYFPDSGRDT